MTTEAKALALVNEICLEKGVIPYAKLPNIEASEALCRTIQQIEQHEAFRQEVSDAVAVVMNMYPGAIPARHLSRFIIPKPKPDPLVDVAKIMGYFNTAANAWAGDVRAALEARGLEIREENDG